MLVDGALDGSRVSFNAGRWGGPRASCDGMRRPSSSPGRRRRRRTAACWRGSITAPTALALPAAGLTVLLALFLLWAGSRGPAGGDRGRRVGLPDRHRRQPACGEQRLARRTGSGSGSRTRSALHRRRPPPTRRGRPLDTRRMPDANGADDHPRRLPADRLLRRQPRRQPGAGRRAARSAGARPAGGGDEAVARHTGRGKLLARDRIDRLRRPGLAVPRAVAARRLGHVRRRGAVGAGS